MESVVSERPINKAKLDVGSVEPLGAKDCLMHVPRLTGSAKACKQINTASKYAEHLECVTVSVSP